MRFIIASLIAIAMTGCKSSTDAAANTMAKHSLNGTKPTDEEEKNITKEFGTGKLEDCIAAVSKAFEALIKDPSNLNEVGKTIAGKLIKEEGQKRADDIKARATRVCKAIVAPPQQSENTNGNGEQQQTTSSKSKNAAGSKTKKAEGSGAEETGDQV